MPLMDLEDVTINYSEAGEGSLAFVHCHGLGGSGEGFIEEFDFWKEHFGRVITWDNRGLGESSQSRKYSLPLYASDLAGLLGRLGVTKAVVHGVSWGGLVICSGLPRNVCGGDNRFQLQRGKRLGIRGLVQTWRRRPSR